MARAGAIQAPEDMATAEALGLDEDHPPLMLVVIGKGAKPARPRLGLLSLEELVSLDRFGNHSLTGEVEA